MKKHVATISDPKQNVVIWGEFRFAVIGHLIASHIDRGQIGTEVKRLSERTWKHPISGQDTRFSSATIERWYYRALNADSNPTHALGPPRSDAGSHRALPNDGYAYLHSQFRTHRQWSYRKLYNKLEEFAKKRCWESLPSYATVRRYLRSMKRSLDHDLMEQIDKLECLVGHLRRRLITQSVRLHLLRESDGNTNIGGSQQFSRNIGPSGKQYILDRLRDYKRAGGTTTAYCQSTGISAATILRRSTAYTLHGLSGLVPQKRRKFSNKMKTQKTTLRVLEIFHNQPRTCRINRSSWSGKSLADTFQREYRESISAGTARRHLRKSGYTMRRARQVLTSTDPEYRQKVELLIRTYERKRGIKDITIRLWSRQFNKICRNANRLGYYTPDYEWGEWNIKDKPIRYLTDDEEQKILKELDPCSVKDPAHNKGRQSARDIFILMVDGGFRINEASVLNRLLTGVR